MQSCKKVLFSFSSRINTWQPAAVILRFSLIENTTPNSFKSIKKDLDRKIKDRRMLLEGGNLCQSYCKRFTLVYFHKRIQNTYKIII